MAGAARDGGWPSEIFEPGEESKAEEFELVCVVCQLVMREPTVLDCANDHALCLINNLRVHCRFQTRGCEWRGDVASFAAHASGCPAGWDACAGCAARIRVDGLAAHQAACRRPCPNKELGCSSHVSVSELQAHLERCARDLVIRLTEERDNLARQNGKLKRRVEDLSEQLQLESVRRRLEAPAGLRAALVAAAAVPSEVQVAPGQSIMRAVALASAGQTIRLGPGVHRERVVLDKEVHLVGSGARGAVLEWDRDEPVLHCKGASSPAVRGITIRIHDQQYGIYVHEKGMGTIAGNELLVFGQSPKDAIEITPECRDCRLGTNTVRILTRGR
eukprot:tig00000711_g3407.t1